MLVSIMEMKNEGKNFKPHILTVTENVYVHIGTFNDKYGLTCRTGQSFKDYLRCDFNDLAECFTNEQLMNDIEVQQLFLDMFISALCWVCRDCKPIHELLCWKEISQSDESAILEFYKEYVTHFTKALRLNTNNVSITQSLSNFNISSSIPILNSKYDTANVLYLYDYEGLKSDRDWIKSKDLFNTEKVWEGVHLPTTDIIKSSNATKLIGTVYFTDENIILRVVGSNQQMINLWYKFPTNFYNKLKLYDEYLYIHIIDMLLLLAKYRVTSNISNIDTHVITDTIFEEYVKSINSEKGRQSFLNACHIMNG